MAYAESGCAAVLGAARASAAGVLAGVEAHLDAAARCEVVRDGVRVSLFGAPNAGKSSLLNALVRRPAAIVSPQPGTTRDVLDVTLDLSGLPVVLSDTAGLRAGAADEVEVEGQRRAVARIAEADLRVCVVDAARVVARSSGGGGEGGGIGVSGSGGGGGGGGDSDTAWLQQVTPDTLVVLNKADLLGIGAGASDEARAAREVAARLPPHARALLVSCRTGRGIDALQEALEEIVRGRFAPDTAASAPHDDGARSPVLLRERHTAHLLHVVAALRAFMEPHVPLDAAAEELRIAVRHLGQITGRVDVEEVLDALFQGFCVGK